MGAEKQNNWYNPPYGKDDCCAFYHNTLQTYKYIESSNFYKIHPCINNIVYPWFEDFRTFLCIFVRILWVL